MPEVEKIRFVGGPWHNSLRRTELRELWEAYEEVKGPVPAYRSSFYHLCSFRTELGTWYRQYVHESMFIPADSALLGPGSVPMRCTFSETFPPFEICELEMLSCLKSK